MRKALKRIVICLLLCTSAWCAALIADHNILKDEIIRLHVVANSDREEDQQMKLLVRDAVLKGLEKDLNELADADTAREYLQDNLPKIQRIATDTLKKAGCLSDVRVKIGRECFDTREYETFTLPAGIYDALRITIGEGNGKNWWCVVFPSLCIPASSESFLDVAASSGFSEALSYTLAGEENYKLRFLCLDAIGKLENMLRAG